MSFAIFVSETATVLRAPEISTRASRAACASNGSAGAEIVRPALQGEQRANALGELGVRVEAGADSCPAERDLAEARQRALDAGDALANLRRVAAELLAEGYGHGVHEVRAAGLHDVVELLGFPLERGRKRVERREQAVRCLVQRGQVHGRREDVIRRLAHVHVVVRVDVVARQRRDHLVRVHVRRRARAGLEDVDRELVVELTCGDAVGGGCDALGLVGVEQAEIGVHAGCSSLDPAEPAGDGSRDRLPGNGEVLDRLPGLGAPELVLHGHAASLATPSAWH